MPRLTESQMKYLHVIYKARRGESGIRSVDVSRELGITRASVCRMVKLLVDRGLIAVKGRGHIDLTAEGRSEGDSIHKKVMEIHAFFAEYLGLSEPEATDSAYAFMSGFSDNCVDKLLRKGWMAGRTGA